MALERPDDKFPTSKTRSVRGTRHMAREKVLQILAACFETPEEWGIIFPHIFFRQFTFEALDTAGEGTRILRPEEVMELDADIPIQWSKEDEDYAVHLLQAVRSMLEKSQALIDKHAVNWDLERIALLDRILMHMAVAELITCHDIPVKVTINEVIELAKRYSTDKSGTFINGILDAAVADLRSEGRIVKEGRGLQE